MINLFKNGVYKLANGDTLLLSKAVKVSGVIQFWMGTTNRGERFIYDVNGKAQIIRLKQMQNYDIVDRVLGVDEENFKMFTVGSLWTTPAGRVWEVVAISRDEKYPVVANELLPDNSFHANIKRFDWDGKPHDGAWTQLLKRVGP